MQSSRLLLHEEIYIELDINGADEGTGLLLRLLLLVVVTSGGEHEEDGDD